MPTRRLAPYAFLLLSVPLACATPEPPAAPALDPSVVATIDSLFAPWDQPASPGAAVLVARHGEVLFAKGYGYTDTTGASPLGRPTPFRLGSVSKQFTTMAIMILAERGVLDYDDPAATYVPEIERFSPQITIRHLMTHTSGIPDYYDMMQDRMETVPSVDEDTLFTNVDAAAAYRDWGEPVFDPGERYEYSNPAYELLALIVERVSGQTFGEFLRANIFEPSGMTTAVVRDRPEVVIPGRAVGYRQREDGSFGESDDHPLNWIVGAGGIYASLDDLLAWDRALAAHRLVSAETMAEAWSPFTLKNDSLSWYGFGWGLAEDGSTVRHSGGWVGFHTHLARSLDTGLLVVVLTNAGIGEEVEAAADAVLAATSEDADDQPE